MPNVKISQLPYNGNPDSSALIAIVQSGVTYRTDFVQIIDVMLANELSAYFQLLSNLSQNVSADGSSTTKYPAVKAIKDYVDGIVVGLLSDRGNYTPGLVSPGAFPSTGGRGPGGIPAKGDLWFVAANGFLGTTAVTTGQSVRALIDAPGQTAANWDILDVAGWTVAPEDSANKVTSKAAFISNGASIVRYPSVKAVKDYIDQNVTLQGVINNDNSLVDNINAQGLNSATVMLPGVTDINAFGSNAATGNQGSNVNAIGADSCNANGGDDVNAMGRQSGENNSGDNVQAIGSFAAESNQGDFVVAVGDSAARANGKDYLNGIGFEAGKGNNGLNVSAIGYRAALNNQSNYVNAIGDNAASGNSGQDVNVMGRNAGSGNTGDYISAIGNNAGLNNTGDNLNALGDNSGSGQSGNHVNAFGKNAGQGNTFDNVTLLGQGASADGPFQLVFSDGSINARFDANSIPADTKITLPTVSGTMVMSVNTVTPDNAGNITLPAATPGLPYLVYAAYLTFGPLGITAVQLYNTIGDGSGDGINDIAWAYAPGGWYQANMSAGPFTSKSAVVPSGYIGNGQYFAITGSRVSNSQMQVFGIRTIDNSYATAYVSGVYVEIRIYP